MSALDRAFDRALDRMTGARYTRSWPVGHGEVMGWETTWGHDKSLYSPEEYGDYLTTASAVFAVVTSRARLMSSLSMRFYRGMDEDKKLVKRGRAVGLYRYVNPYWTRRRLDYMDELCMCLWGESYWALEPPSPESPLGEIWWLKPTRVRVLPHPTRYVGGYVYTPTCGQDIVFQPDEIVHFKYPNPLDEFSPLAPMAAARLAAETAKAMMAANNRMFSDGMQIAGMVTPQDPNLMFTPQQADDLEEFMRKKLSGPDKAHRWVVLRHEAKFTQMSITPKDAEYIAGLNMSFRDICRAFGMQPTLHGDLEQAAPGDVDTLERAEWARSLKPDAELRSEEIVEQYLTKFHERGTPNHAEYAFDRVPALQQLEMAQWERLAGMVDRGLLTINEARRMWGRPDVLWGDHPWMAMNKAQFLPKDEEPKGKLVIPGQDQMGGMFGGFGMFGGEEAGEEAGEELGTGPTGTTADQGLPQSAMQGGPVPVDEWGVPIEVLPDDEIHPLRGPGAERSHWAARCYLSQPDVQRFIRAAFGDEPDRPAITQG